MPREKKPHRPTNEELCDAFVQLVKTAGRREILVAFDEITERLCPRPPGYYEALRGGVIDEQEPGRASA